LILLAAGDATTFTVEALLILWVGLVSNGTSWARSVARSTKSIHLGLILVTGEASLYLVSACCTWWSTSLADSTDGGEAIVAESQAFASVSWQCGASLKRLGWEESLLLVVGVLSLVEIKVRCRCCEFDYICLWLAQAGLGLDGWLRLAICCWGQHFHRKEFIEVNLVFIPALLYVGYFGLPERLSCLGSHTSGIQNIHVDILNVIPGLWEELALCTALAGAGASDATQARQFARLAFFLSLDYVAVSVFDFIVS
jgi:hypothetical protein